MPEGVGGNGVGVCIEDPIDLPPSQMAIPPSWEQIRIICLRSTPEILAYRIYHLVTEVHYPHFVPLTVTYCDFAGLQRDILHSQLQTLADSQSSVGQYGDDGIIPGAVALQDLLSESLYLPAVHSAGAGVGSCTFK